jgi:hypothetical protein
MNYVYEGLDPTGDIEAKLLADKAFPLVRELRFKYNLQAVAENKIENGRYQAFTLCNQSGINVARVYYDQDEEQFCYYSTFYQKDRGSDNKDRHTLRSKKLSLLMANIKKNGVIPTDEFILLHHISVVGHYRYAIQEVTSAVGSSNKNQALSAEEGQALLEIVLDGKDSNSLAGEMKNKFKQILDNYQEKDNIKVKQDEAVDKFFKPCYMVSVDKRGQFVVGVVTNEESKDGNKNKYYSIVKPFKRVANLEDYPELLSYMTMLKVYSEEKFKNEEVEYWGGFVPKFSGKHIPDLDMIISSDYVDGSVDFTPIWVLTPCLSQS